MYLLLPLGNVLAKPIFGWLFQGAKAAEELLQKKKKKADFQQNVSISKHFAVKEMV